MATSENARSVFSTIGIGASPLQIDNFFRYVANKADKSQIALVVLTSGNSHANNQLVATLSKHKTEVSCLIVGASKLWEYLERVGLYKSSKLVRLPRPFGKSLIGVCLFVVWLFISGRANPVHPKIHELVLGDGECRAQGFARILVRQSTKVVLVDDGVMTLRIAKARSERRQASYLPIPMPAYKWNRPLIFFTIFHSIQLNKGDTLRKNETYRATAPLLTREARSAWILGANIAEAGFCSENSYRQLLLQAVSFLSCSSERVIYLPHRLENEELVGGRAGAVGIQVQSLSLSVERHVLESGFYPGSILSFASTAPALLSQILPSDCVIHSWLPPTELAPNATADFERVQDYYRLQGRVRLGPFEPSDQDTINQPPSLEKYPRR